MGFFINANSASKRKIDCNSHSIQGDLTMKNKQAPGTHHVATFFDGENKAVRRRKAGGVSSEYSI